MDVHEHLFFGKFMTSLFEKVSYRKTFFHYYQSPIFLRLNEGLFCLRELPFFKKNLDNCFNYIILIYFIG